METIDTLSSCSNSKEQQMQQMLKRTKILKDSFLNGLSALKSNFIRKHVQGITKSEFECAFSHIFGEDVDTFIRTFSQNMDALEQQLTKETIIVSNCHNAFKQRLDDKELQIQECTVQEVKASDAISEDKAQKRCMRFIKSQIYLDDKYVVMTRNYFLQYTQLDIPEFRNTLIQLMESVKKPINERVQHKQEYDSRVNDRQMQTIEEKVDMSNVWMLVWLTQKAVGQNQKSRIQVADQEMMHILMMQVSGPYMMKIQWLRISKPRSASQIDVNNDLSKPVTTHYLPKERKVASAKPHHAMTSDHNSSELGIHDHSNEPSSSKLVPKSVPLADKTATSRQELELLFYHHITMLRVDFKRWQKKMYFLLSNMSVVYVLTTLIPKDEGDNLTVEQVRKRAKKEIWDSLEVKYMAKDVSNFKHTLKHKKEELTLVELDSHLRIEESLKAVVRLPDPKLKTLGERGIECIFVGYAKHSNAFRFYIIEPNDSVSISSIIKSRDAIFDENRLSSIPRPSLKIPNGTEDIGGSDVAFWKEAINDEMDSIMGNNTWVLADLPPGCKHLGCKWIFKRKLKVDETIKKFKAMLVNQGFKQKSGIDYFDTYALVACINTIRLLISMASIYNLIIYQMDVETAFLNGDLDEEVYINQPHGFIMPDNKNMVCKLIKSLYGLKHAPKQWHQKFDKVVLSNGYLLNQADKCVYSKFDKTGKSVIIFLYVDDMLIFGTNQVQVDLTKEFLSSMLSMNDMGEADVILGIKVKHKSNEIAISQSHYIEKAVSQLEYSRVIGCLMYAMTCTRPDIAFVVGKMSRYTSNRGTQHWQAIQRVLKYLKKTMDYRLTYTGYPSVLEGYTNASWISNTKDNSSTSGWIPLWSKPITPISIRCDSVATLAKAYSQMYNGKSRNLSVRHSMIRELITNEVVSIEFVRSQRNLADHLTKELARDLVLKSVEGMGLKSN
uniref:Zinc finger, CCHC-type n=1 Tax=Tanacetum cinerariifolium TaxID=118510 RepID=A0A6L2KU74_TANCI|nr:zinc finger, CCHC-type [Tanacetum cinerariifolium]